MISLTVAKQHHVHEVLMKCILSINGKFYVAFDELFYAIMFHTLNTLQRQLAKECFNECLT